MRFVLVLLAGAVAARSADAPAPPTHKLLIFSVDGLDWRYLRDRDSLGLHIPHLREMLKHGRYPDGVIGVWPTVTWPSHTSLITGARPDQHGILGNRRPKSEGGDYYWTVNFLKRRTLWQAAHDRGWVTGSVTWPVTAGASIDFDLPEFFFRRQGGSMDLEGVASKATPGLVDAIAAAYPSFPQEWVNDRTRTLATIYLLRNKRPDLLLVHLVDLDSEEHDEGPFTRNANAILERTDELIGQVQNALPADYDFALVSDHGFERVDRIANVRVLMASHGVTGNVQVLGGIVVARDQAVAAFLRKAASDPANAIGREIPHVELEQYAPNLASAAAVFGPADHVMFGNATAGNYFIAPVEKGNHGFWPTRADYRSVLILSGPGIQPGKEPAMQMVDVAGRLARLMGLSFP